MVFDLYREALLGLVVRRSLGNRPRPENAVHLQPQIEMEIPRGVLVDDKQIPGNGRDWPERLGRSVGRPFGAIAGEVICR